MRKLLSTPLLRYNYLQNFKKPVVESNYLNNQCLHILPPNISTKWSIILPHYLISI